MAMIDVFEPLSFRRERQRYVRAPRPIEFPSEESVPETKRHLEVRTTLYLLLKEALPGVAIGSEQFVYYDAGDPKKCLSPDVLVKRDAREEPFDIWKIWERGAPDLAVEIVSPSDQRDAAWSTKLARYQASGITEVVRFDPDDEEQPLRVWDRVDGELLERAPDSSELRACVVLGAWWVIVDSPYGPALRLARDREGRELYPTPSEKHEREEEARKRVERHLLEEREAREAVQAENERLRAELAKVRGVRGEGR